MKLIWLILFFAGFLVACSDDDNDVLPIVEIGMSNTAFIPAEVSVPAGTTVSWINNSSIAHTVTSNDGLFDEFLEVDQVFTYTFNDPGNYSYICTLHPGMDGIVVVE